MPITPLTHIPNRQFGLFDKLFKKGPEQEDKPKVDKDEDEVEIVNEGEAEKEFQDTEE